MAIPPPPPLARNPRLVHCGALPLNKPASFTRESSESPVAILGGGMTGFGRRLGFRPAGLRGGGG